MKKLVIIALTLLILATTVYAEANIYLTKDFEKNPIQVAVLSERDAIKINWEGKEHQVMVRKIYTDQGKADLTTFVEGSEVPFYTTITRKTSLQLDFDQDMNYDLKISIFNILEDEEVIALKIEVLEKIEEETENTITQIIKFRTYIILALVLIILVIWKRRSFIKVYRKIKKKI